MCVCVLVGFLVIRIPLFGVVVVSPISPIRSEQIRSDHINKRQAPRIRAAVPVHTPLEFLVS